MSSAEVSGGKKKSSAVEVAGAKVTGVINGRCMKCRDTRPVIEPKVYLYGKNPAIQGKCGTCSTKISKIMSAEDKKHVTGLPAAK